MMNINSPEQHKNQNTSINYYNERNNFFGDILYDKIESFPKYQNYCNYFGKIVGMFLELDDDYLYKMIKDDGLLNQRVKEALRLLDINYEEYEEQEDENIPIKYEWLKKEILTQEMINKDKDKICSICLEVLKLNEDISPLKCGHFFHYKCIQNLVDHNFNSCPNCRSDLKTGEKQSNKPDDYDDYDDFFL